jgi:hypothetical protein
MSDDKEIDYSKPPDLSKIVEFEDDPEILDEIPADVLPDEAPGDVNLPPDPEPTEAKLTPPVQRPDTDEAATNPFKQRDWLPKDVYDPDAVEAALAGDTPQPEAVGKPVKAKRGRGKEERIQFVLVPALWKRQLVGVRGGTYDLALELLTESWLTGEKTVPVSNILADRVGLNREAKRRALSQLVDRSLIRLSQDGQQAPRATLLGLKIPPGKPSLNSDTPSPNSDTTVSKL